MKALYHLRDDILELHFSDKAIVRERSQDWNVHVGYADDDTIVEMVILDAVASGLIPFRAGEGKPCEAA